MGNLVWAIEAVLLGTWGFVLSVLFSTPFHQCMALTQLTISTTTLVFHAIIASRNPPRAFAVSQAYACSIAALGLVYTAVLLSPDHYAAAFNSPTIIGPLPLAANVGLAWLIMLLFGAVAMSIQDVNDGQRTALFMHPYGYHMVVGLPCLVMMNNQSGILSTTGILLIWALYISMELVYRSLYTPYIYRDELLDADSQQDFILRLQHKLGYPIRRLQAIEDLSLSQIAPFVADLVGKGAMLTIVVIAFINSSGALAILCLSLLIVAGLHQLSWLAFVDWILGDYSDEAIQMGNGWPLNQTPGVVEFKDNAATPSLDTVASAPTLPDITRVAALSENPTATTAPTAPPLIPTATPATSARFRFPGYQSQQPDLHLPLQWRDKAV